MIELKTPEGYSIKTDRVEDALQILRETRDTQINVELNINVGTDDIQDEVGVIYCPVCNMSNVAIVQWEDEATLFECLMCEHQFRY